MKILITNDDGIVSPSLPRLADWAEQFGEVTVIAPRVEQSGRSQAIDFHDPIEIKRVTLEGGREAWAVASTPADCVRFGFLGLKEHYDLVLSGINRGYNLGEDIVYSGTIGAIFEAARMRTRAIAFSCDVDGFDGAFAELDTVYDFIVKNGILNHTDLINVNFPAGPCKGISITRQGGIFYSDGFVSYGNDLYMQMGEPVPNDSRDITVDISAVKHGYISVTPLTANRTDMAAYDALQFLNS